MKKLFARAFPLMVGLLVLACLPPVFGTPPVSPAKSSAASFSSPDLTVRIGIAYDASQSAALDEGRDKNSRYVASLQAVGAKVVLLRIDEDPNLLGIKLSGLDGILLPGGCDVAPHRYGETPHPKLERVDEPFDGFEFRLLEAARNRGLPVLGICRGHQILNIFLGGSLYQDIPTQVAASTPVSHRLRERGKNSFCSHPIVVATDSTLFGMVGTATLTVNTFHHQGLKALGSGLRVTATTADGVVEAIEGPGPDFLLGVQFHPERESASDPAMRGIFEAFVKAARDRRNQGGVKGAETVR